MKTSSIDNSIDLKKCILWQYDRASNLKTVISAIEDVTNQKIGGFWDSWLSNVFNIDTADAFGLSVWGRLYAIDRPEGMSDDFYRRLIKGRIFLSTSNCSADAINKYLGIVFRQDGNVVIIDNGDMSIDYSVKGTLTDEEKEIVESEDNTVIRRYDEAGHALINNDQYRIYSATETYDVGDKVRYRASAADEYKIYKCIVNGTTGVLPTDTTKWEVFSETVWFYYGLDASGENEQMIYSTPDSTKDTVVLSGSGKYHAVIFPYPTGTGSNVVETIVGEIGLNDTDDVGQNLENMALDPMQDSGGAFRKTSLES